MKSILFALALILAVILSAGVTYWLIPKDSHDSVSIVEGIHKIAHLATVEYRIAEFIEQRFYSSPGHTHSSTMLSLYTGTVTGSVDLENTDVKVLNENNGSRRVSIYLKRGSIKVPGVTLIPGKDSMREIVTWKKSGFMWNGPSNEQRDRLRQKVIQKILDTALKEGIVKKTIENARTVLTAFVAGLGYEVDIDWDKEHAYDPKANLLVAAPEPLDAWDVSETSSAPPSPDPSVSPQ